MVILAVDTSGRNGSLALARVTPRQSEIDVLEVVPLAGGTFSAQLVPQIGALLAKHGFTRKDINGFAVASGPGSFTGLRVGLAAIKALAEILHQPIAVVSLLEAVAHSSAVPGPVLSVLDAGRGELYVGEYELQAQVHMRSERLLSREQFLAEAQGRTVITPETGLGEAARAAGIRVEQIDYPRSDMIARLGWERIRRGETVQPEDLEANYIRRSDAEIFSHPKLSNPMPVKIRTAIPADVPAILAIEQQAPTAAHWSREQYTRRLESGLVLMAEEQGKIAGFICANPVAGDWEIENVVVAPEFQRQGIADRLMRELIDQAITQGKSGSQILLEVRESSLAARALYQKHGFQEVGRRRAYYQDPLDDALLYSFRFGTETKDVR